MSNNNGSPKGLGNVGSMGGLAAADRHGNNGQERSGPGRGGVTGQGTWLNNRQYQEYLELLKERARSQAVVSVPLERVGYPTMSLQAAVPGRPAYGVTQPDYSFLAPTGTAAKASGYAGTPSLKPVGQPSQFRR